MARFLCAVVIAFAFLSTLVSVEAGLKRKAKERGNVTGLNVVVVNDTTAELSIEIDGVQWLKSAAPAFHSGGVWYSTTAANHSQPLTPEGVPRHFSGSSAQLGDFTALQLNFTTANAAIRLSLTIEYYAARDLFILEQRFPDGLPAAALDTPGDAPVTCFPALETAAARAPELGALYQHHIFGNSRVDVGLNGFSGGVESGTPLVLFDPQRVASAGAATPTAPTAAVVLSPIANYKVAVHGPGVGACGGTVAAGFNSMTAALPVGFAHRSLLVAGSNLHDALQRWGEALLAVGGKLPAANAALDVTANDLSYWTDNGAYYYYFMDTSHSYEKTMKDVYRYHVAEALPVQSYQLDSWWYKKYLEFDGGLVRWEPQDLIFPDGIQSIYNVTQKPFTLHNRWFSSHNDYMGKFKFATQGLAALPVGSVEEVSQLYSYLFRFAAEWGLKVYEQDWLRAQFLDLDITRTNVTVAHNWQAGMALAAARAGLLIQYCMPLPSDYLMSTLLQPVSQIRVSNDYASDIHSQWRIGKTSMFAWALGLRPFKDVFRTTQFQPPNVYALPEPNPELQAVVATLSAGPVGFGDKIGSTNATIIFRTCMRNGTLLPPSRPATAVEAAYLPAGMPGALAPESEVWSADSIIGSGSTAVRSTVVLAADIQAKVALTPCSLRLDPAPAEKDEEKAPADDEAPRWMTYTWRPDLDERNVTLMPLTQSRPLNLAPHRAKNGSNVYPWELHAVVPVLDGGWVLLGEAGKYVAFSPRRMLSIASSVDTLEIVVAGAVDEEVKMVYRAPGRTLTMPLVCAVGPNGQVTMTAKAKGGTSCDF